MITGIHHIAMKCNTAEEFEKEKDFYLNVLGLRVKREWAAGIMIDTGIGLIEIFNSGGMHDIGVLRHFALASDDTDDTVKRVRDAGYEVFVEPKDIVIPSDPELLARIAFCRGPQGEEIEIFQEK